MNGGIFLRVHMNKFLAVTESGIFCPSIFGLSVNSAVMTAFPSSHMPSSVSGTFPE